MSQQLIDVKSIIARQPLQFIAVYEDHQDGVFAKVYGRDGDIVSISAPETTAAEIAQKLVMAAEICRSPLGDQ